MRVDIVVTSNGAAMFPCFRQDPLAGQLVQLLPFTRAFYRADKIMSSAVKSASFLYVPRPKSFSYESRSPSTKPNSGAQPNSCLACTTHEIMRGQQGAR